MLRRAQNGDTMVEVMIAMLIIGVVLVGAYTVTNNGVNAQELAIEKEQGVELVQSQVEQLRSTITDAYYTLGGLSASAPFCFQNTAANTYPDIQSTSATPPCFFDYSGNQITSPTPTGAYFALAINLCQVWPGGGDPCAGAAGPTCPNAGTTVCPWQVTVTSTLWLNGVATTHQSESEYKVYSN